VVQKNEEKPSLKPSLQVRNWMSYSFNPQWNQRNYWEREKVRLMRKSVFFHAKCDLQFM
jgi:hypothetical protein